MYQIGHFDTSIYLPEMMLMMPKTVRPPTLFIDKIMRLFYLRDLRKPTRP